MLNVGFLNGTSTKRSSLPYRIVGIITDIEYHILLLVWLSAILAFATAYFLLGFVHGHGPTVMEGIAPLSHFLNSLYFSIITATSTGYGDITPVGFSKVLASMQSMISLFVFAVFVTKLVSHRQDVSLQQIHKLTFENVFHNIREGFFIVRKDLDRIIEKANHHHLLEPHDWIDLMTAYRQGQSFLHRITDFYDENNRIYKIDERREELLQDGVHRTLLRIEHLLMILESKDIQWFDDNHSLEELREFIQLVNKVTRFWMEQSPYEGVLRFEELLTICNRIHAMIEAKAQANGSP